MTYTLTIPKENIVLYFSNESDCYNFIREYSSTDDRSGFEEYWSYAEKIETFRKIYQKIK